MPVDPEVIAAIEAAVAATPDNLSLRVHLAGLLVGAGRHTEALAHIEEVLRHRPDSVGALAIGADCADAVGQHERADAYRRLAAALDAGQAHTSGRDADQSPTPTPRVSMNGAGTIPDTAEELLDSWRDTAGAPEPEIGALSRPTLRLTNVGGMVEVKRRIETSFLAPLRNPQLRAQFGKSLRGGLLLWGPPGCGKTYLARALAGELGASFYEIGLSDVLDMWIGSSERNLHATFDVARAHAPCLLFFDEIDALGHKRANLRGGGVAMRGVVNQFLVELDGASANNEGLFVLAASNHPWDIDSALIRPGRFDRSLFVAPPDQAARQAILALHLAGKPSDQLDLARIAKMTDGLSGADLALICDDATERALDESITDGRVHPIGQRDLLAAARAIKSSVQPWLDTARNYVKFANTAGQYDELADYLNRRRR